MSSDCLSFRVLTGFLFPRKFSVIYEREACVWMWWVNHSRGQCQESRVIRTCICKWHDINRGNKITETSPEFGNMICSSGCVFFILLFTWTLFAGWTIKKKFGNWQHWYWTLLFVCVGRLLIVFTDILCPQIYLMSFWSFYGTNVFLRYVFTIARISLFDSWDLNWKEIYFFWETEIIIQQSGSSADMIVSATLF